MKKMKRKQQYIAILVFVGLYASIGTVFAEDSPGWLIETDDEFEYKYEYDHLTGSSEVNVKGDLLLTINEVFDNGTLWYQIQYHENLEYFLSGGMDPSGMNPLITTPILTDDQISSSLGLNLGFSKTMLDNLNFSYEISGAESHVNMRNENGENLTFQGWNDETSFEYTIEGTNINVDEIYYHREFEINEEGMLVKSIINEESIVSDSQYHTYISCQLKTLSISGFPLEFFGISFGLVMMALVILHKSSNRDI